MALNRRHAPALTPIVCANSARPSRLYSEMSETYEVGRAVGMADAYAVARTLLDLQNRLRRGEPGLREAVRRLLAEDDGAP